VPYAFAALARGSSRNTSSDILINYEEDENEFVPKTEVKCGRVSKTTHLVPPCVGIKNGDESLHCTEDHGKLTSRINE
jgi:hypothetical protein